MFAVVLAVSAAIAFWLLARAGFATYPYNLTYYALMLAVYLAFTVYFTVYLPG